MLHWLRLTETQRITDLDDPSTSLLHREIIQKKAFLRNLYIDFYRRFGRAILGNRKTKLLIELGSGGGFIKEILPEVITSDVQPLPHVDMNFSALDMPFGAEEVDGYFLFDVLHHLPNSERFFKEVQRTLKKGGRVVMIEPAGTLWSRFIFQNFHHEPFQPQGNWTLDASGPLSSANGAIPWIIFYRDRRRFERQFPSLKILKREPHTPLRYLLSGGLSFRQFLPSLSYRLIEIVESVLAPLNPYIGMFMTIILEKEINHSLTEICIRSPHSPLSLRTER